VLAGQRLHRPVLSRLTLGDPCRVNQPGAGGPLPVSYWPVLRVEGLQEQAPDRSADRVGGLQRPQPLSQRLGGQVRRALDREETGRGLQRA
jgi:hypothetical protein